MVDDTSGKSQSAIESMDAMVVASNYHRVLFENDQVRVLETRIGPGEKTPVHTHRWSSVQYVLSWSPIKRYDDKGQVVFDSESAGFNPPVGEAFWSPPIYAHFVENVGKQELRVVAVELKNT